MRNCTLFALLFLAGCSDPPKSTFHGRITIGTKAVQPGVIYFMGPNHQMGMGTITDDGQYTATDVPFGEVRVGINAPGVPEKYSDVNTSKLTYIIEKNSNHLDIQLPPE